MTSLATQTTGTATEYDAFLSYAHRDRPVTVALQKGLHQIGRHVGQLRALRVFRDDTNLTASPDLWGRITDALDTSRFMIVVLSPQSAASHWVDEEIGYWLAHRGDQQLMLVLAEGQLVWDATEKRFDPAQSDAAPPALTAAGSLPVEPLYIDVTQDEPWDLRSPLFRDKLTSLAAPIHGKPKDQLSGDDLREQRRFRRLRTAAVAGLALLTVIAVILALVAFAKQREATARLRDAVVAKLNSEGAAMLAGLTPGGDVRGMQELLAANAIHANGVPILNAQIARFTTQKIVDTGSRPGRLAYSPDGRRVATAQADGTARQWDSATGGAIEMPRSERHGQVHAVAYTPDGRAIATAADDGFRLLDATTGATLSPTEPRVTQQLNCVAVSPDGNTVITGDNRNHVQFWDAHSGRLRDTFPVFSDSRITDPTRVTIADVAFDREGTRLAVSALNGLIAIYDTHTGEVQHPVIENRGPDDNSTPAWQAAFSRDGHTLAVAADSLQLWNLDDHTLKRKIALDPSVTAAADAVAFTPDGRVATARNDGSVQLWDADTGAQLGTVMSGHTSMTLGLAVRPDGRQLATASFDGTLRLWSATTGQIMRGHDSPLGHVAFSPDGRRVAVSGDTALQQWNLDSGQPRPAVILAARKAAIWFDYTSRGQAVVAGGDGIAAVVDPDTGSPVQPPIHLPVGDAFDNKFAASRDGRWIAWGSTEQATARLTEIATGKDLVPPMTATALKAGDSAPELSGIAVSADGHHLVIGYDDGLREWNTDTGQPDGPAMTDPGPPDPVTAVAFDGDNTTMAVARAAGPVELWDASTRAQRPHSPLPGHTGLTFRVAFGPGHQLASGGNDDSVRLWDTTTGAPTAAPIPRQAAVTGVALSPDGRLVASISLDGTLLLSPALADPGQLCDKLSANMTQQQWRDWVSPGIPYITVCPKLAPPRD